MVKEHYFLVRHSGLLREGKIAYFGTLSCQSQCRISFNLPALQQIYVLCWLGDLSWEKLCQGQDQGHIFFLTNQMFFFYVIAL